MVARARRGDRPAHDPRAVAQGGFLTEPGTGSTGDAGSGRAAPPHVVAAANTLRIDLATIEAVALLRDAGVESILLKGPTFARWLYDDPRDRPYTDADLLVSPDDLAAARAAFAEHGFTAPFKGAGHELIHYAEPWIRRSDAAEVDLHHRLPGIADSRTAWRVLSSHTETTTLRGLEVAMLDEPARALHVVLHAAQHGTGRSPSLRDLQVALERLDAAVWAAAAALARDAGAEAAFESGLRLTAEGAGLLERLDLGREGDSAWELAQILRDEEPGEALVQGLVWFRNVRGVKAKATLLLFKVFPPGAVLKTWSPLARRGPWGVAAARVWRPFWLLLRAPAAILRYRRARALQRERERGRER